MATIVQNYGPIYGEVVNGTVQGRPNGSVYVPISNTIAISLAEDYRYLRIRTASWGTRYYWPTISDGSGAAQLIYVNANAQDLASYVAFEIYQDPELTTLLAQDILAAGVFHDNTNNVQLISETGVTVGDTVYLIGKLYNNSTPIAVSDVIECEVVLIDS